MRQHSAVSENQNQHQRPFTTEGTEDTEKNQGLPQMDVDERGLQVGIRPVEWKPTADMYRMDTREGREAYEASLWMTVAPRLGAERRSPQPAMTAEDPAQVHAVLG
jgi:hypothetical protein